VENKTINNDTVEEREREREKESHGVIE